MEWQSSGASGQRGVVTVPSPCVGGHTDPSLELEASPWLLWESHQRRFSRAWFERVWENGCRIFFCPLQYPVWPVKCIWTSITTHPSFVIMTSLITLWMSFNFIRYCFGDDWCCLHSIHKDKIYLYSVEIVIFKW